MCFPSRDHCKLPRHDRWLPRQFDGNKLRWRVRRRRMWTRWACSIEVNNSICSDREGMSSIMMIHTECTSFSFLSKDLMNSFIKRNNLCGKEGEREKKRGNKEGENIEDSYDCCGKESPATMLAGGCSRHVRWWEENMKDRKCVLLWQGRTHLGLLPRQTDLLLRLLLLLSSDLTWQRTADVFAHKMFMSVWWNFCRRKTLWACLCFSAYTVKDKWCWYHF